MFRLLDKKEDLISNSNGRIIGANELESPRKAWSRSPLKSR